MYMAYSQNPHISKVRMDAVKLVRSGWSVKPFLFNVLLMDRDGTAKAHLEQHRLALTYPSTRTTAWALLMSLEGPVLLRLKPCKAITVLSFQSISPREFANGA